MPVTCKYELLNNCVITLKRDVTVLTEKIKSLEAKVDEIYQVQQIIRTTYMSSETYNMAHKELVARADKIEQILAASAGASSVWIAMGTSGVAIVIGIVDFMLRLR